MKFVKKTTKTAKDICYLHNCPRVHDGKPCPMLVVAKEGESVTCPICGTHVIESPKERLTKSPAEKSSAKKEKAGKKEKKILYWTDPMIPGYKSDKPGKSPMGMDMVPVYEEDAPSQTAPMEGQAEAPVPEGYSPVLLTPQKQQLIGIKTSLVEKRQLTKTIRAVGTIAHDPELYQAQAEYIQAVAAYQRSQKSSIVEVVDQSRRLVESARIRLKHLGLSDELIEEIGQRPEPEHGLLYANPGQLVWMYAQVYEYELPLIQVEQNLIVEVPALSGQTFPGKIRSIDPLVDPTTRTTRIRAQLENPQGQLKPGMYVNATIRVNLGEALTVPQEAVFNTGTKQIVFVDKGQGLFEPRDVVLGSSAEEFDQVKEGLQDGERVVTSGNFLIDSESRLKAALEGMSGPTPGAAVGNASSGSAPQEGAPQPGGSHGQ